MTGMTCLKEETNMKNLEKIVSLCGKYLVLFPSKEEWLNLFSSQYVMMMLEKLVYIINARFLNELHSISPDPWIEEHVSSKFPYAMDSYLTDFFENPGKYNQCGICNDGSDIMYFMETAAHGISISENNHWFSFYKEFSACISRYNMEYAENPEKIIKYYLDNPEFLMKECFPEIIKKDPDFIHYGYKYVEYMLGALESDYDFQFIIHAYDKLHEFLIWSEEEDRRKHLPEVKKLLDFIEQFREPMADFSSVTPYYYIRTLENTYICYLYYFDDMTGFYCDGKFFYPSHFFVMVAIECLLKIIAIKYY